jgi:hypothetical protein
MKVVGTELRNRMIEVLPNDYEEIMSGDMFNELDIIEIEEESGIE